LILTRHDRLFDLKVARAGQTSCEPVEFSDGVSRIHFALPLQ
jgi:hypothetical protein